MSDVLTAREWLSQIADYLDEVSRVLAAENKWLKPQIDEDREQTEDAIKGGWKSEDDRAFDQPLLWRNQVDKHMENIDAAAKRVSLMADNLRTAEVKA